jgi:general secretion pathway protein M
MTDRIVIWVEGRSRREQVLLATMAVLLAIVLGWLLIARPLAGAMESAKARRDAAVVALAEAQMRADRANAGPANVPVSPPLPLGDFVRAQARDAGFGAGTVSTDGPARARLALASARPQALFAWLASLQAQGVIVDSLRARANPDRTISVEATLRAQGAR